MYSDPDGEFLGIPMLGLSFIADLTSNLINGVDHPVQTAWNNATATVNGMDQCLQFSVPIQYFKMQHRILYISIAISEECTII